MLVDEFLVAESVELLSHFHNEFLCIVYNRIWKRPTSKLSVSSFFSSSGRSRNLAFSTASFPIRFLENFSNSSLTSPSSVRYDYSFSFMCSSFSVVRCRRSSKSLRFESPPDVLWYSLIGLQSAEVRISIVFLYLSSC